MLIAQQKQKENIAEYILYMWQVEDMIRACNFDIDIIQERIVNAMSDDEALQNEIRQWYAEIARKLKLQGKEKSGHLRDYDEQFAELNYLHGMLLNLLKDEKYQAIYEAATPGINDFKVKANTDNVSDIEVCFHALYAKLMLRLQQREISEESESAFKGFAQVLGYLSAKFNEMKEGKLS